MRRARRRSLLAGMVAAVSASAVGVSVNIATEHQGSLLAWAAVAACTAVVGAVTATGERAREAGRRRALPRPEDVALDQLTIEITIGAATFRGEAHGRAAVRALADRVAEIGVAADRPPPAGSPPVPLPVALATPRRAAGSVRRFERAGRAVEGVGALALRMCAEDPPGPRRAALCEAAVLLVDDVCSGGANGGVLVGGLDLGTLRAPDGTGPRARAIVLACHGGADEAHVAALRRSLDRPVAFLGCRGRAPEEHREALYPALLRALSGLGGSGGADADAERLLGALDEGLALARAERPRLDWGRWRTAVLRPGVGR
ncbi:hypothetical protein GCM10009678_76840 [Actinomadura kijaniata]|uniref:hypothetical protein n=1 Tax=Actinomadura kijaniata TaxID=46161 RepID=UPI002FEB3B1F